MEVGFRSLGGGYYVTFKPSAEKKVTPEIVKYLQTKGFKVTKQTMSSIAYAISGSNSNS